MGPAKRFVLLAVHWDDSRGRRQKDFASPDDELAARDMAVVYCGLSFFFPLKVAENSTPETVQQMAGLPLHLMFNYSERA